MAKRLAYLSLITSAGILISWLEFLFIPSIAVPGVKLGLSNVATLIALYLFSEKEALAVCVTRVAIVNLLFGSISGMLYGLTGGVSALVIMSVLKRLKFSVVSVSSAGGVCHSLAQLALAAIIVNTVGLIYYAPVLIISGAITGIITGVTANTLIKTLVK